MTDDAAVERMAAAIAAEDVECKRLADMVMSKPWHHAAARAALSSYHEHLSENGIKLLGREPTEKMYHVVYIPGIDRGFPNNISQNNAGALWQAMHDAAEGPGHD